MENSLKPKHNKSLFKSEPKRPKQTIERSTQGSVKQITTMDTDLDAMFAEQRREIELAKVVDSDLDLAYSLQMHEAITASLSSAKDGNPSSSRYQQTEGVDLSATQCEYYEDDGRFDYTALLVQDIERLDQERRDREASELLKREMREDLERRIHDQIFSTEIMNIPDYEWEKTGEYYQKPYGNCDHSASSSSGSRSNSSYVNVYCKGLESEERIKDMSVFVGGVGVAVCDLKDNLLFEVSKPSDLEKVGLGLIPLQAFIEALNAALALDLQYVNLFCDDFKVYNYVTGRVQPTDVKVSTLVNQISTLQKEFTDCRPSLVSSSGMKFVLKLARDAIVSQIAWTEETTKGKKCLKETCTICYENKEVAQMFSIEGCLHRYCFSCMKQHVEVKLLNGKGAICPQEGCVSEVSIESCGKFLDPKLVEIMSQRKREASIAVTEKVYCPNKRCSFLMSKSEVLLYTHTVFVGCDKSGARKCLKCHQFFCINCMVPWHYDMTCHAYKISNPNPRPEDATLNTLARRKQWRQCVKCSNMVELAFGCYHITCRCGHEFCYTCGKEWKNKKATCNCPVWDERNIIRNGRGQ